MQGGRGPGGGIYVARRVLAALVVLLLLVLLVPWACQNLVGQSGEQSGSETSETADVDSSDDGGEEAVRDEEAATDADSGAERKDTVRGLDSETGSEDEEDDSGDEEDGGASNVELEPLGFVAGFEAVDGAGQVPPTLDLGAANQQAIQPVAPTEPVFLALPSAPVEPLVLAEPIIPAEPVFFEDPFRFEDPFLFEEPVAFEEPPVVLEEPVVDGAGPIATTNATDVEVERHEGGGWRGNDRLDIDRGGDDGRDLGPI